jgi:hypothetical protein
MREGSGKAARVLPEREHRRVKAGLPPLTLRQVAADAGNKATAAVDAVLGEARSTRLDRQGLPPLGALVGAEHDLPGGDECEDECREGVISRLHDAAEEDQGNVVAVVQGCDRDTPSAQLAGEVDVDSLPEAGVLSQRQPARGSVGEGQGEGEEASVRDDDGQQCGPNRHYTGRDRSGRRGWRRRAVQLGGARIHVRTRGSSSAGSGGSRRASAYRQQTCRRGGAKGVRCQSATAGVRE